MTFKVKDGLIVGNNSFVNANLDVNANSINVSTTVSIGGAVVNSSFFTGTANTSLYAYGGKSEESLNANSALYSNQANYALIANSALYAFGGKVEESLNANSAVYAVNAQFSYTANVANFLNGKAENALDANTAQYANYATYAGIANVALYSYGGKAEEALNANSATYAVNAEFAYTANVANYLNGKAEQALDANTAQYANYATYAGIANAALYSYGGKAEEALNANSATYATNAQFAYTANVANYLNGKAETALDANSAIYATNAQFAYVANVALYSYGGKAETALNANSALYANVANYLNGKAETALNANSALYANVANYLNGKAESALDANTALYANVANYLNGKAESALAANSALYANVANYLNGKAESALAANSALYANVANYLNGKAESALDANTAQYLGGFNSAYYTNATNLSTGTVAEPRLPFRMNQNVRTTDSVEFRDLVVTGNVFFSGNATLIQTNQIATVDSLIYLNNALTANVTNASGNGSFVTYVANNTFVAGESITIEGMNPSSYNIYSANNLTIATANATQFTVSKTTTDSFVSGGIAYAKAALNPDVGFVAGLTANNTYQHVGFFRDATDGVFKAFDSLIAEPDGPFIDLANARIADIQANTIYAATAIIGNGTISSALYSGTANNATYLNGYDWTNPGAIGTGVANTGKFTDLTVTGNAVFGDAYSDLITFNANNIVLNSNLSVSNWVLFVDSSTRAIGVNTYRPSSTLTVNGGISTTTGITTPSLFAFSASATGSIFTNITSGVITLGGGLTTGGIVLGGINSNGAIQIGRSTNNQIVAIANGATASGNTKIVTIGTGGLTGSNTLIQIGANTAQSNVNIYANLTTFSDRVLVNTAINVGTALINSSFFSATANNANYFNGQLPSYYTNATNISTGTLSWSVMPTNSVNTSSAVAVSNTWTFQDIIINGGIKVQNSFGNTNQVLASNGTGGLYWKQDVGTQYFIQTIANTNFGVIRLRDANNVNTDVVLVGNGTSQVFSNSSYVVINTQDQFVGTVTSIDSGPGLVGGPITDNGTIYVGAGAGISVNQDDVAVNAKDGLVANSSGLWVNTYYFSILSSEVSSNNAFYLQYKTWEAPGSIGNTTPNDGKFLNLQANTLWVKTNVLANGYIWVNGTTINSTYFPASANNAYRAFGKFENQLNVNSAAYTTASNNASYLNGYNWDSPPKIGETTANTGKFTYANVSSHVAFGTAAHMTAIGKITVSGTSPANIIEFPTSIYSGGKLIIEVTDTHTNFRHISELLLSHDNTKVSATEYGVVQTGNTALATFNTDILSGNVRILATPISSNTTTFKIIQNLFLE